MIVTLGEAVLDLFAAPVGTTLADAPAFVAYPGGAALNVAVTVARQGVRSRLVAAVGRDAHGDRLVRELRDAGVDVRAVVRVPERTAVTFVHVAEGGARAFLSYRDAGADRALAPEHLAVAPDALEDCQWLHVDLGALAAEPLASTTRALVARAELRGVALSVDLNARVRLWRDRAALAAAAGWIASRAALVKASEDDLCALGLAPALAALRALAPAAVVVLSHAQRGACAWVAGRELKVPAPGVRVVDPTGAGDALVGGLLAARSLQGASWEEALQRGCALGSQAVTALGATEALRPLAAGPRQG